MKEPKVSVAMATYNGERFLQEQLDSLARQTLLPYELVACDDGSKDGTLDILHGFAQKAPFPVRIHQNETRLGHGDNFLQAASLCSGELIAFADQDDVWLEPKLERCSDAISKTASNLVIHSAEVVDERLVPKGFRTWTIRQPVHLDAAAGWEWHALGHHLATSPGFACVFRSRLVRQIPVSSADKAHETWLYFAAEVAGSVTLIPDMLVFYRQHATNTIGFRTSRLRGRWPFLKVGTLEYLDQSEDSRARVRVLADAASRLPELRPRLLRAQKWYEARADSLARRASLYGDAPSVAATARQLFSMAAGGTYRPISRGGLGLKGLAKDLFLPVLRANLLGTSHGSITND